MEFLAVHKRRSRRLAYELVTSLMPMLYVILKINYVATYLCYGVGIKQYSVYINRHLHHNKFEKFVSVTRWSEKQEIRLPPSHMYSHHLLPSVNLCSWLKSVFFFSLPWSWVSRMCILGAVNLTTLPKTLANKCTVGWETMVQLTSAPILSCETRRIHYHAEGMDPSSYWLCLCRALWWVPVQLLHALYLGVVENVQ